MTGEIEIYEGSGNVFADLGLPNAEQRFVKAMISILICREMKSRGLTDAETAGLLGISPRELSSVVRGALSSFSLDRLFGFAAALGIELQANDHA